MSDFGTGSIGYLTIDPGTTSEEQIQFTGLTQNANGTATITGVSNLLTVSPYTATSGMLTAHAGGATVAISNTAAFYAELAAKRNNETITGTWTFSNSPLIPTPTTALQAATKGYADGIATAGAPNAATGTKGIVQAATQAQVDARTTVGSTGALLFPTLDTIRSSKLSDYVADTGLVNALVLTPVPAWTSYSAGQRITTKVAVTNTGAATVNVSALGVQAIKKLNGSTALAAGDMVAGQVLELEYDGTNFQMLSPVGNPPALLSQIIKFGGKGTDAAINIASGTQTISLGGAAFFTYNAPSISITGTGQLAFTNPHPNGTIIWLRSQGAVTITGTVTPSIGAAGANGSSSTTSVGCGGGTCYFSASSGADGYGFVARTIGGNGSNGSSVTAPVTLGTTGYLNPNITSEYPPYLFVAPGAAGGDGGGAVSGAGSGFPYTFGTGGKGGNALIIECAGAYNFTGSISLAGGAGGSSTSASGGVPNTGGPGAGGAGGTLYVVYNTLTANSGVVNVSGGAAGTVTGSGGPGGVFGGNGGSSVKGVGTTSASGTAGVGAVGMSIIVPNTEFI